MHHPLHSRYDLNNSHKVVCLVGIVYTSACIESARIEQHQSDKQLYENCSSHTWNKEDDAFDHQLDKWGVD